MASQKYNMEAADQEALQMISFVEKTMLECDYQGGGSMAVTKEDIQLFEKNRLRDDDTFQFECLRCGSCCRKRKDAVVLNGPDLFRVARALGIAPAETAHKHTRLNIGSESHLPVLVLRERLDGSCSLLRNGRCTVQQNKPAVCALFPLGRMYDSRDNQFHYFWQGCSMGKTGPAGKVWTLREWLDEFGLRESEEDVKAWTQLARGLAAVTHPMKDGQMSKAMLETLLNAIYLDYDISQPYAEQVQAHMVRLKTIFPDKFKKKVSFD